MITTAITTPRITAGTTTLTAVVDHLPPPADRSLVAITSKVAALCENRIAPADPRHRQQLIRDHCDWYHHPPSVDDDDFDYHFTIVDGTLIPASGIDASNAGGNYVLWPASPCATANLARNHLMRKHRLRHLGVIITDSTISLSRWGTQGIVIGHSGLLPTHNYIGQPDLFDRPLEHTTSNLAGALAAAAVLAMGEGNEQTPLAVITDLPATIQFTGHHTRAEHQAYYISPLDDRLFQPFFRRDDWHPGGRKPPRH